MALTGWEARPFCVGPVTQSAGGAAIAIEVMNTPRKLSISAAKLAVAADITADNSNYVTISLTDGSTTYATINTKTTAGGGSGDISAHDFVSMTVGTAEVDEDTDLYLTFTQSGTGVDVTNATVQLEFSYIE